MVNKLNKYKSGLKIGSEELCPLCLEKMKKSVHKCIFPLGFVLVKKDNYALIKVSKDEPIVNRMLKLTNNKKDDSKEFIILYVDKTFVGYKGRDKIKFILNFSKESYKKILRDYKSKSERKNSAFETNFGINSLVQKRNKAMWY